MARSSKKSSSNHGRPITSFFALSNKGCRPSGDASSSRMSSRSQTDVGEKEQKTSTSMTPFQANLAGGPRKLASGSVSPRRSERAKPVSLQPAAVITSLKRARTPDAQPKSLSSPSMGRPRGAGRKSKFDTDSEVDPNESVIYVKSPNSKQRKRARLSPQEVSSNAQLVPSSQSDEEELPSVSNSSSVPNTVDKRFAHPSPHRDEEDDCAMLVDDDRPPVAIPDSQDQVMTDVPPLKPSVNITQVLSPPSSDLTDCPPTPVATTNLTETIIAAIKARAYTKISSSPEPDQLDFKDDLDSSDDDQIPVLPLPAPRLKRTTENKVDHDRRSTRYSLRNRSDSPMGKSPSFAKKPPPTKAGKDPFTALLKEKRLAEKRGNGSDAINKAELTTLQYGKDGLIDEMDEEEDENLSDWGANSSSLGVIGILNSRHERKDDDSDTDKLCEEDSRKTVLEILEQDKAERRKAAKSDKIPGIRLWSTNTDGGSSEMAVDKTYQIPGDSTVILLLNSSLTRGDPVRITSLLNVNVLLSVPPSERAGVASCFCDISLSPRPLVYVDAIVNTLEIFWSSALQPATSSISFHNMLSCLKNLEIDCSVLAAQNWSTEGLKVHGNIPDRDAVIHRLVILVATCARSGRLRIDEVPDILIGLILIGMEAGISPNLQREITLAIDLSVRCLSPDRSRSDEHELGFCLRILQCAASYSPVNKLRLLSLLSNGSGPARRVANFVAHCVVTDKYSPTLEMYTEHPPLADILEQLQPYSSSNSEPPSKFAVYEGTDYIDIGFYISILGIAISNMKGYVSQERQKLKSALPESPIKVGEKPKTELQLLHAALETLHSKITDSRAAHLERSRTKAAVKQLAMNVHYQREMWLKNSQENKSKTLAQYFKKKS